MCAEELRTRGGGLELSRELERILLRCAGMVRSVARAYDLVEKDDVDEIFQDVRIRLWRSLGSATAIREVSASYVYRTATAAAIDLIRRRRARPDRFSGRDVGRLEAVGSPKPGPGEQLAARMLEQRVERSLTTLIDSRRPVVRAYLAGYRLTEIAELMGWTHAKVRNLLYRGLSDLQQALRDQEPVRAKAEPVGHRPRLEVAASD